MCGILVVVEATSGARRNSDADTFLTGLSRRGPDGVGMWVRESCHHTCSDGIGSRTTKVHVGGSLLQLRGELPSATPLVDADGNVLCFNGEIFDGLDGLGSRENDAKVLLDALGKAGGSSVNLADESIPKIISSIRGPWCLVYWHEAAGRLWYARDPVGRRSLLVHRPDSQDSRFILTTLSQTPPPPDGDLCTPYAGSPLSFEEVEPGIYSLQYLETAIRSKETDKFIHLSRQALGQGVPWCCQSHEWKGKLPNELLQFKRSERMIRAPSLSSPSSNRDSQAQLLKCQALSTSRAADGLLAALDAAVERRVADSILMNRDRNICSNKLETEDHADLCVLFSGGVDSMVLAALADRHCDPSKPIDLCTVCFDAGSSPDRAAALDGVVELRSVYPNRRWRLILVDSSLADVDMISAHLAATLYPSKTVMDFNIGGALWFAARAAGRVLTAQPQVRSEVMDTVAYENVLTTRASEMCSDAKVILLGQGADEQCAGYGRHRSAFRAASCGMSADESWARLSDEIALDVRRIWKRNLGRDDRLVGDHGREARFPFLDEGVIMRLLTTPLREIADFHEPPGVGDKLLIRQVAKRLGLHRAAKRVKRAIQFGTRISRESNRRDFGSGRRANKLSAGLRHYCQD